MWILIWEEVRRFHPEEVEHVQAHRTKKEMQHMSLFERFIAEGNEKADALAKRRSDDGWRTYGTGRSEYGPPGKRKSSCSIAMCSWLSLSGGIMERL